MLSDDLPNILRRLRAIFGGNSSFVEAPSPFHFVVDASHAIAAVRYKASRAGIDTRVHLEEICAAGLAVAYTPHCVEAEVEKTMGDLVEEEGLDPGKLHAAWDRVGAVLIRCTPSPTPHTALRRLAARDPKDLPYCQLYFDVEADALLSDDHDYKAVPDIRTWRLDSEEVRANLDHLRKFGRAKAEEANAHLTPAALLAIGTHGAEKAWDVLRRAPTWVQFALLFSTLGVGAYALSSPSRREKTKEVFKALAEYLGSSFGPIFEAWLDQQERAALLEGELQKTLGQAGKPPLGVAVYRRLLRESAPQTLTRLVETVADEGYGAPGPHLRREVATALRAHPMAVQDSRSRWLPRGGTARNCSAAGEMEIEAQVH